jgi:hypothetical protein
MTLVDRFPGPLMIRVLISGVLIAVLISLSQGSQSGSLISGALISGVLMSGVLMPRVLIRVLMSGVLIAVLIWVKEDWDWLFIFLEDALLK